MAEPIDTTFYSGELTPEEQARFNDLFTDIAELQFEVGLDGMNGDDGFYDIFANSDKIGSQFNVTVDTEDRKLRMEELQEPITDTYQNGDVVEFTDVVLDDDTQTVQEATVEFVGVKNTKSRSKSATTESTTFNIDPQGASSVENAEMKLTGERTTNSQSQAISDGDSVSVSGNNPPENESVTIEGSGDTNPEQVTYSNTSSESDTINIGGYDDPYSEEVIIDPIGGIGGVVNEFSTNYVWSVGNGYYFSLISGGDSEDSTVKCYNLSNSNLEWTYTDSDGYIHRSFNYVAPVGSNRMYIAMQADSSYDFDVKAINLSDGTLEWEQNTNTDQDPYYSADGNNVFISYYDSQDDATKIMAFDESGTKLWETGYIDYLSGFLAREGLVVTYGTDGSIKAFNQDDGSEAWLQSLDSPENIDISSAGVFVGNRGPADDYSKLAGFDLNGNEMFVADVDYSDSTITSVIASESKVYTHDEDDNGSNGLREFDLDGNQTDSNSSINETLYTYYDGSLYYHNYDDGVTIERAVGVSDPSVSVGDETVSVSGALSSSYDEYINLTTGSKSVDISSNGNIDVEINWTEDNRAQDPSVTIDGSTVSHTGALGNGETETGSINISGPGTYTASVSTNGGSVSADVDWQEVTISEDPSIELDSGTTTLSRSGQLSDGETISKSINLTTGTHSATVSSNGSVQAEVVWDDVSITEDPEIVLNGNSVSYTGSIADGNSQTVTVDPSYLSSGTNSVTVNTVSATPNSDVQVKLTYGDNSAFLHSTYNNLGFVPSSATLSGLYEADQDVTVTFYIEDDAGNSVEIPSFDSETSLSALSSGNVRLVAEIDRTAFSQSFSFDNYSVFFTQ